MCSAVRLCGRVGVGLALGLSLSSCWLGANEGRGGWSKDGVTRVGWGVFYLSTRCGWGGYREVHGAWGHSQDSARVRGVVESLVAELM